jgi:hypothetical protein
LKGEPVAVVLSPSEFDRLEEQDHIRREAKMRLRETISSNQREASDRGSTGAELQRLMPMRVERVVLDILISAILSPLGNPFA